MLPEVYGRPIASIAIASIFPQKTEGHESFMKKINPDIRTESGCPVTVIGKLRTSATLVFLTPLMQVRGQPCLYLGIMVLVTHRVSFPLTTIAPLLGLSTDSFVCRRPFRHTTKERPPSVHIMTVL